jgi:hypothetical protein
MKQKLEEKAMWSEYEQSLMNQSIDASSKKGFAGRAVT